MKKRKVISIGLILVFCFFPFLTGCEKEKCKLIETDELKNLFLKNEIIFTETKKMIENVPLEYEFSKENGIIFSYKNGVKDDYQMPDDLYKQLSMCFDIMENIINPNYKNEYSLQISSRDTATIPHIVFSFFSEDIEYTLAYSKEDLEPYGGILIKNGWYYYDFAAI